MNKSDYAIGQAIYSRTDVPDYREVAIPFQTLGELMRICSETRPNMLLDKVVLHATVDDEPRAVTLRFVSAGKGVRPAQLDATVSKE